MRTYDGVSAGPSFLCQLLKCGNSVCGNSRALCSRHARPAPRACSLRSRILSAGLGSLWWRCHSTELPWQPYSVCLCPDQSCEQGGEKSVRLLVVLHLPLGEALFFVYSTANFEVGCSDDRQRKKTAGRSHICLGIGALRRGRGSRFWGISLALPRVTETVCPAYLPLSPAEGSRPPSPPPYSIAGCRRAAAGWPRPGRQTG